MSRKPESIFRDKVRKQLVLLPNSWFESIQQRMISGTPDLLGCINVHFIGLELKSSSGQVTPIQEYKLKQIAKAGGIAIVTNPENWDQVLDLLQHLSKGDTRVKTEVAST